MKCAPWSMAAPQASTAASASAGVGMGPAGSGGGATASAASALGASPGPSPLVSEANGRREALAHRGAAACSQTIAAFRGSSDDAMASAEVDACPAFAATSCASRRRPCLNMIRCHDSERAANELNWHKYHAVVQLSIREATQNQLSSSAVFGFIAGGDSCTRLRRRRGPDPARKAAPPHLFPRINKEHISYPRSRSWLS